MTNLQDARLKQIAEEFIQRTDNLSAQSEIFDTAYEWLSEQLPDFAEFEMVCMELGIA
ncbi:hypothetical protein LC593_10650 [Nostoc sp. CHAB 5844]|nr:hypothetical protein [Nostoc sp. CHAB 5844]